MPASFNKDRKNPSSKVHSASSSSSSSSYLSSQSYVGTIWSITVIIFLIVVWIIVFHHPDLEFSNIAGYKLNSLRTFSSSFRTTPAVGGITTLASNLEYDSHHQLHLQAQTEKVQNLYNSTRNLLKVVLTINNGSIKSQSGRSQQAAQFSAIEKQLDHLLHPIKHKELNNIPESIDGTKKAALSNLISNLPAILSIDKGTPRKSNPIIAIDHNRTPLDSNSAKSSDNSNSQKWLVIGIPTVARPGNEDYLLRSLFRMSKEFPTKPDHVLFQQVMVVVVNRNFYFLFTMD
jgi:hypothetical protein